LLAWLLSEYYVGETQHTASVQNQPGCPKADTPGVFTHAILCLCVAKSECYMELARCIELVFDMWLSVMYPFS